jgi:hypothetical protein
MTNIAVVEMAHSFIDGLPFLKMVIFHGDVSHNQMVYGILRDNLQEPPKNLGFSLQPIQQRISLG